MTTATQIANLMKVIAQHNANIEAINGQIATVNRMSVNEVRAQHGKPKSRMLENLKCDILRIRESIERLTAAMIALGVE